MCRESDRSSSLRLVVGLSLLWPACLLAAESGTGLAWSYWEPVASLPPARAALLPPFCEGRYRAQALPYPESVDDADMPVVADADQAAYWIDGEVELRGNVVVQRGNRSLRTDSVTLDRNSRQGTASGAVTLEEPGLVMQGDRGDINLDTYAATLTDVEFLLLEGSMRGTADALRRDEAGTLSLDDGSFTRCEPGNDTWRISASSVQVEEDDNWGTARNAVVRVGNVPVFYTPYIRFPVNDERQSGFLFPNLGYSSSDGVDVSLPYYLNLAPNYDATIMPRYIGDRGAGLEGEFRHLSGWEETTFSGAFLPKDDLFDGTLSRDDFDALREAGEISGEFDPADRWLYAMDHTGEIGPLRTRVDYTAVSDRDYFRDLGSDLGVNSDVELERRGEISYSAGGFYAQLWAQRFQRLDEVTVEPYQRLPQLDLSYLGQLIGPLEFSLSTQAVTFERKNDDLVGIDAAVGDRIHVEPRLRLPLSWPWGFVTLAGGYRYTTYDLRDMPEALDDQPDRGIGIGSADAGLFFEREFSAFGTGLVQTLEPRIFYLYQEYEDQSEIPRFDASELTFGYSQLFRDNRFSGLDRIGDANQVSVGMTTRFVNAFDGREYLRFSVGEIFYFEDRRVTLAGPPGDDQQHDTSELAAEVSAALAGAWRLTSNMVWDHHDSEMDELGAALQYRRDNRHIFNLGYRKRSEQDIDQTDVSLYWPVSRHFAVLGRWNYDVESGRTIEGFAGFEYNNCCWQVRVFGRRFINSPSGRITEDLDQDKGIFLQVVFKGLSGFGNKVENILGRGIRGYRSQQYSGF